MSPRRRLVAFNISVTQQDGRYISGMTARPSPLWGTELPRRGRVIPASQSNALTGIATTTFVFIA